MRIRLSDHDRAYLFEKLAEEGRTSQEIADTVIVSTRMIFDWKRGKYTIPEAVFRQLLSLAGIDNVTLVHETLEPWWYTIDAGKRGAKTRMEKYGDLGTPEGRLKGGRNSYLNRKDNTHDIFAPKDISRPRRSKRFAEFIGIMIGDGNATKYQISIASNTVDDREYIIFIAAQIYKLFGVTPTVSQQKNSKCTVTVASSVKLVELLKHHGVLEGHKLRQNLDIPRWILENTKYSMACIRGIFDTDGGIYLERHKINGKLYCYPRLSFVSMSYQLRLSIYQVLVSLDFSPKIRNNRSVNLEKRSDIKRYFELIGSSNPKHVYRWEEFGGVG